MLHGPPLVVQGICDLVKEEAVVNGKISVLVELQGDPPYLIVNMKHRGWDEDSGMNMKPFAFLVKTDRPDSGGGRGRSRTISYPVTPQAVWEERKTHSGLSHVGDPLAHTPTMTVWKDVKKRFSMSI
jgi:hypothetical protein